ncbi:MAG: AbrB/MazE/SpoVT family DNA-binding domain-containing protein [Thermomicrobiales bacterium]|nr:AbrB/MazE/SpoVT family DNA-binding domain-containing protein [Thermomicrobiales bacterium]
MATTTSKTRLVRSLRGGQMTIPIEFRRALGIDEETMLRVTLVDGELRVSPVNVATPDTQSSGLKALYDYFAPTREAVLASGISEDELLADITGAVAEVRAGQRSSRE